MKLSLLDYLHSDYSKELLTNSLEDFTEAACTKFSYIAFNDLIEIFE